MKRRDFLATAGTVAALNAGLPPPAAAQNRNFDPKPGKWRTLEITTRVEVLKPAGMTRVWIPVPAVNDVYQRTMDSQWTGNARSAMLKADGKYGADMVYAEFDPAEKAPVIEVTSRFQTQDRALEWDRRAPVREDAATLKFWTEATEWMPTDGIVRKTALEATRGKRTEVEKVQALYDWVVANTYREPKVKGCGTGDIKSMLETGNMGGKCGDINALFVGMARSLGIAARDVYGIRVVPSAFGYKELGAGSANISRAQHCRAEVFLRDYGWVAMDPADVGKVMRLETTEWIKDVGNPVVAPVKKALFGGWEGNWLAYNTAHDVALPGSKGPRLAFFMYPQAENANGRYDPLEPDTFKYSITGREIKA